MLIRHLAATRVASRKAATKGSSITLPTLISSIQDSRQTTKSATSALLNTRSRVRFPMSKLLRTRPTSRGRERAIRTIARTITLASNLAVARKHELIGLLSGFPS